MDHSTLPPAPTWGTAPPGPPVAVVHATPETPTSVKESRVPLWARMIALLSAIGIVTVVSPYMAFIATVMLYGWDSPGVIGPDASSGEKILYIGLAIAIVWSFVSGPIVLTARWVTTHHRRLATALAIAYPVIAIGLIALASWLF